MLSAARKKANDKYIKKAYDRFAVRVYKVQLEQIKAHAAEQGLSINGYVNKLISADMGDKLTKTPVSDREWGK